MDTGPFSKEETVTDVYEPTERTSFSPKPLNFLCFDGGGVRGLSSLLMLRSLIEQLRSRFQLQTVPLPCEVFDMVCGTSMGGIIALMLGRLRMSVEDVLTSYLNFSRTVFEEQNHTGSSRYDASKLEKWVKRIVAKYGGGNAHASLRDPEDRTDKCCRTFMVAVRQLYADAPPRHFRTYTVNGKPADQCEIWEAARATTAASPFFDAVTFCSPRYTFVGGSLASNNPAQLAIDGVEDVISVKGHRDEIAKACMELVKNCERVHNDTWKDFIKKKVDVYGDPYFRFSVDRCLGKVKFDERNREAKLAAVTDGYMEIPEVEDMAMKCVETLYEKAMDEPAVV